jgi:hypothetical protein
MHKSVRVKPQLQWRPQDIGDARNMEHILRKATGIDKSQTKREDM